MFSTCCVHTQYIFPPNTAGKGSTCVVMLCTLLRGGEEISEFALAQEPVTVPTSQFASVVTRAVHSSVDIFHALCIQQDLV